MRIDTVLAHQARERGAVREEIILLDAARLDRIATDQLHDILAHPHVDQREQIGARRIERVIEIENPVVDMRQLASMAGQALGGGEEASQAMPPNGRLTGGKYKET